MSVPAEFHSTLWRAYYTLGISVRQPITEVKAEWNVAADVWEIAPEGINTAWIVSSVVSWVGAAEESRSESSRED